MHMTGGYDDGFGVGTCDFGADGAADDPAKAGSAPQVWDFEHLSDEQVCSGAKSLS
jgi:hypothetical protein